MNSKTLLITVSAITALYLNAAQPLAGANPVGPSRIGTPGATPPPPPPHRQPSASNSLSVASLAQCAPGFMKVVELKQPGTHHVQQFTCTTPIIKCPVNPNFHISTVLGKVNTNAANNPEQGALTLSYTCMYRNLIP